MESILSRSIQRWKVRDREYTLPLSIQTQFIEFVLAETNQLFGSNSNVILTRQSCGSIQRQKNSDGEYTRSRVYSLSLDRNSRKSILQIDSSEYTLYRYQHMGWLRLVSSLKLQVSFGEYLLFNRALLQKSPILLRSLLIVATPQQKRYTVDRRQRVFSVSLSRQQKEYTIDRL